MIMLILHYLRTSCGETVTVKGRRMGGGEEFRFDALRCDNARALARYSSRRFCNIDKIKEEQGLSEKGEGGEYSVLQYNLAKKFKAVVCERKISTITAVCGAFSHSKLVEPPDILKPVKVKKADCQDVADTKMLTTEDGRQLKASLGTTVIYKFIDSGSVTLSANNVACEGGEMKLMGKKHESVIVLATVHFKIREIDVTEYKGSLKTNEGWLPRSCSLEYEGCVLDDMTLVINLARVNMCPYAEVRKAKFKAFQMGEKNMLQSDENKMLFQTGGKIPIPSGCVMQGNLIKTNFDRLYLLKGEMGTTNIIGLFNPSDVDLDLEMRLTDFYMEHWSLAAVKESTALWQSELCSLAASRLNEDHVVLHGDHLLRMKGEIVNEFKCQWIIVTTRAGFKAEGEKCLDHLPVFTDSSELMYLTPMTRLLEPRSAVTVLNCSANFPITIEDKQGRMITANPNVAVVEVALSEYHLQDVSNQNHTELFEVKSLLYTPEEVHDYEQLLLGPSSERAVTKQFSSYYCQASGECMPSRDTQDFRWNRMLQDPSEIFTWWWEDLKDWLLWWGAVWGCVEFVMTMVTFAIKLMTICCHMGKTDMNRGQLVKFVFMPGPELVNLFPAKREVTRARPRTRRPPVSPGVRSPMIEDVTSMGGPPESIEMGQYEW